MRRFLHQFDLLLIFIPLIFSATSVATIYALVQNGAISDTSVWWKQLLFTAIGFVIAVVISMLDYRALKNIALPLYIIFIVLLIAVLTTTKVAGSSRWFQLGFFLLQPSEFSKIALLIALAFIFERAHNVNLKRAFFWGILSLIPIILVLRQPDLGTALVLVSIALFQLFSARPVRLIALAVIAVIALTIITFLLATKDIKPFGGLLKSYQRERVITFINPKHDPLGSGYNVTQSIIAIGAGGIKGKGLGQGSQTQLKYVPAPSTDFVFAAFAESFGFLGAALFIIAYIIFLWRIMAGAQESRDDFGAYLAVGVFALYLTQLFINVGMTMGVTPITGIPLPYMSYGGSNMLAAYIAVGIVQSIVIRRKRLEFK